MAQMYTRLAAMPKKGWWWWWSSCFFFVFFFEICNDIDLREWIHY